MIFIWKLYTRIQMKSGKRDIKIKKKRFKFWKVFTKQQINERQAAR